ncbi:uncharacterized protein LOC112588653 isoform X2 [Harpegnathos saltator]|uniref:uncharacterized protein LOC112588653 isoform X2 n=1 Tax=Harpegnathos saltator TaxID=610380 RepID=UPI000DBEF0C2|nr:uncharacterized protein LOC112588653 isoform X2 [Harpegnathos saltator]
MEFFVDVYDGQATSMDRSTILLPPRPMTYVEIYIFEEIWQFVLQELQEEDWPTRK